MTTPNDHTFWIQIVSIFDSAREYARAYEARTGHRTDEVQCIDDVQRELARRLNIQDIAARPDSIWRRIAGPRAGDFAIVVATADGIVCWRWLGIKQTATWSTRTFLSRFKRVIMSPSR